MEAKQTLTVKDALKDFITECCVVLGPIVDLWQCEAAMHDENKLMGACLRWLAGRKVNSQAWDYTIPADPLRWLLEEVRDQIKVNK